MGSDIFGGRAARYEAMIDWERRLANETPFYRRLFDRLNARRVLDVACGTGHHAALFHSWGLSVEGADVSPEMLERCRGNFGESDTLRWVQRSFDEPHPTGGFDVAICVGNSLATIGPPPDEQDVLNAMVAALRPGGVGVVQVLNLWRIDEGPVNWQKCVRLEDDGGNRVLLKGVHRHGDRAFIEVVEITLTDNGVTHDADTATILGFEADDLAATARRAGASSAVCFGNYQDAPHSRATSPDLIVVFER